MIRLILALLSLASFSAFAEAELAAKHQEICKTLEVLEAIGQKGSCRIVFFPQRKNKSGICLGKIGSKTCTLQYAVSEKAAINLRCGALGLQLGAESLIYTVGALVKPDNGAQYFKLEDETFFHVKNQLAGIEMVEKKGEAKPTVLKVSVRIGLEMVELTDPSCL